MKTISIREIVPGPWRLPVPRKRFTPLIDGESLKDANGATLWFRRYDDALTAAREAIKKQGPAGVCGRV